MEDCPIKVFLDISADDKPIGRLIFELKSETTPKTIENFRALCTGEKGFGYKNCIFYRVIPGFCACSGDFETNNKERNGGHSIYEEKYFDDEPSQISHSSRGILSMDNYGWPNTNSSRFFITFEKCEWMNGYHIAFGHLIEGFEVLDQIESLGTIKGYGAQKGETTKQIKIIDCGQL